MKIHGFLLFIVFYKTSNEFVLELPMNVSSFLYSGSVPSLVAGLLFGSLAGLGAYQLSQNPSNVWISLSKSFYILFTKEYIYPKTLDTKRERLQVFAEELN